MPRGIPKKKLEPANGSNGKPMTKADALRRALADLGNDAKPVPLQEYIKTKFGIDMATSHISSAKTTLLKSKGKGKRGRKPKAATEPATTPAPVRQASGGISLADIRAVKELAGRIGADKLKELAELLS